jgi:predicted branched-subunit amino acid permease
MPPVPVARLTAPWDRQRMSAPAAPSPAPPPPAVTASFVGGIVAAWSSVFAYVLLGTYVGIGALAHDYGFSALWLTLSTLLVWAAPAQVILISTLGTGASLFEAGLAVTLSSVRLLPMVVALLPAVRGPRTSKGQLLAVAHLTAISVWVEALRLLPTLPRDRRFSFFIGLGLGLIGAAVIAGIAGFYLAAGLPALLAGALLFLTPLSFLISVTRNSRALVDRLALVFGLIGAPVLVAARVELDLLWTGIIGGTLAYAIQRLWRARQ